MLRRWLLNVAILLIIAYLLDGVTYTSAGSLLLAGAILGLVNASIRPLIVVVTLPLTVVTLGIFTFVISALMLLLTALVVPGFAVDGFMVALVSALLFTLFNVLFNAILR